MTAINAACDRGLRALPGARTMPQNADSGFTINKDASFAGLPKENSQIIFLYDQQ